MLSGSSISEPLLETGSPHCRSQLLPVDGPLARLLEQFIGFRKMSTSKESPVHRQWGGMGCLQDMVTLLKKNRVQCGSWHLLNTSMATVPLDPVHALPRPPSAVYSALALTNSRLSFAELRHRATSAMTDRWPHLTTQLFLL